MDGNWQFEIVGSGRCAMCERTATLQQSHIIPAFVFRWLKSSGPSGHIRNTSEPNKRVQDGAKRALLCAGCEALLSHDEKLFSDLLFYPWLDDLLPINYSEWLLRFCVSVSWRVLLELKGRNIPTKYSENQQRLLRRAGRVWRQFLLATEATPREFEQHFLPFDFIKGTTVPTLPDNINRYLMGTVEMDIVGSEYRLMTFSKLGRFVILGIIQGTTRGWEGTKVHLKQGVLPQQKVVLPHNLLEFLLDRARHTKDAYGRISDRQYEKIADVVEKNIKSSLHTEKVRAIIADGEMFGPHAVLRKRRRQLGTAE
jgi:hypothetical protein